MPPVSSENIPHVGEISDRASRVVRVVACGERGEFGAVADAELGEDVPEVCLDGLAGDEHPLADLAVGEPVRDEVGDLASVGVGECQPAWGAHACGSFRHYGTPVGVVIRARQVSVRDR